MITRYHILEPKRDETPTGRFIPPSDTCPHDWRLTVLVCIDGSRQYRDQCHLCGQVKGAISHAALTQEQRQSAHPFDHDLYQRVFNAAYSAWREASSVIIGERDARWWTWYDDYLDSDVWHGKVKLVILRCGNVCEACRLEPVEHIHHLTYAHVGAEPLFDLVGVCGDCHSSLHGRQI